MYYFCGPLCIIGTDTVIIISACGLKSVRRPDILTMFWAKNHMYLRCDDLQCGRVKSKLSCVNSKNDYPT